MRTLLFLAVLALPSVARADAWSADPNAPYPTIGWRGRMRGTIGLPIAIVDTADFDLRLPALLELYNDSYTALPSDYWRARVGLDAEMHWRLGDIALAFAALLTHESDHETGRDRSQVMGMEVLAARSYTFFYTNDIGLRASASIALPAELEIALTTRLHVLSCTRSDERCEDHELDGAQSFEGALDVSLASELSRDWSIFAALHAGLIVPNRRVVGEARAALDAGVALDLDAGRFMLFAIAFAGSDVGLFRANDVLHLGAAVRYVP